MTPHFDAASAKPLDLSGHWILDRSASGDVRARLEPLFEKQERLWRKNERRYEGRSNDASTSKDAAGNPPPPESLQGQAVSNMHWLQNQRQLESQAIIATVSPATEIEITQSPHDLRFASNKGEGTRVFVPGESSSLFVGLGGFLVTSGWQAQTFVIDSRGTDDNALRTVERYTLIDGGAHLEEQLQIKFPVIGKQEFRILYRRQ